MTPATQTAPSSYDAVPYESLPFAQSHPDRLATLGQLFGLQPAALANCRVLELGCAAGGNLIPMALTLPGAQFVGVDLSLVQVAQGQQVIRDLGLRNITLLARSITDLDASMGRFDYILTHGVYSWVPDAVQQKILSLCASHLSASGIAYVSYNTLPGWRMRGMVRDLMRYHAMQFADLGQRVGQARGIVNFLAKWVPAQDNAYGMLLQSELEGLRNAPDHYILHEHLEDINEPLYFHQFAQRAADHGLQYLAEADFSSMLVSNLPPEVSETLQHISSDVIRQEQFMDFLRNRTFRQTLLVRDGLQVQRRVASERVKALWISADLSPVNRTPDLKTQREESFSGANGGLLKTPNPVTKAAMRVLARQWPAALSFTDLLAQALALLGKPGEADDRPDKLNSETILASDILQCHVAGLLELHACPSPFVVAPGDRPLASPLARWQAANQRSFVTTLRHEPRQTDTLTGQLLQLLDGTRSLQAIENALAHSGSPALPQGDAGSARRPAGEPLRGMLDQLARAALLQA